MLGTPQEMRGGPITLLGVCKMAENAATYWTRPPNTETNVIRFALHVHTHYLVLCSVLSLATASSLVCAPLPPGPDS